MFSLNIKSLFLGCVILIASKIAVVESSLISNLGGIIGDVLTNATSFVQDPLTKTLCKLTTDQLITHYGYLAEKHYVITEDGYNLTLFRCNSNETSSGTKKAVVLQHGILESSDDFTTHDPSQALAYVMADAGYDVWITNSRGNFYSRRHISLSPDQRAFWNFSWTEIGLYDLSAIYDYVIEQTQNEKVYAIGHSQGTTSPIVLLSEKPEYNEKIAAAALMAPVGYVGNSGAPWQALSKIRRLQELFKDTEFLPRGSFSELSSDFCNVIEVGICEGIINGLFGPSEGETNETMLPSHLCHVTSGASLNQAIHYGQEIEYGYFGPYKTGSEIPRDFNFSQITAPMSFHYSPVDTFTDTTDVDRLTSQIKSIAFVQVINETKFNHIDFMWGIHAAPLVYSRILEFFESI
ncbi:lipase 3-like [Sitodiplosis mosellana]|uniref:lipase 3-like n=1 Tax=Sitodiplosis mosellana TaxID=263140 RepID=UPI00244519A7|nr:lipase 3-like [Sitodiplosis mosellana]